MKLAQGIRQHGFRKWYERELLQSHAHLALTFLCAVALLGAFEAAAQYRDWNSQALNLAAILASAGIGYYALRRYLYLLTHAETVANQADCPGCGTYARFDLVAANPGDSEVEVCCRQCTRRWQISG